MTDFVQEALNLGAKQAVRIDSYKLVFDIRARLKCLECRNYGNKMCPPNTFDLRMWDHIIHRYSTCFLITYSEEYTPETYQAARDKSGRRLQEILIALERIAFREGWYWASVLIGGSCRGCASTECTHGPCVNPAHGRTSIEGAGIDVIMTCKRNNIDLQLFPHPRERGGYITRVGMLMLE